MIDWKIPDGDEFYLGYKKSNKLESMGKTDFNEAKKIIKNWRSVIDIGAHIGETAYRYSKWFNLVHAFEPVYFSLLNENIGSIENIIVYPFAASDREEKKVMIRSKKNSGATVIKTKENNKDLSKSRFDQNEIEISAKPIDFFNFSQIDFIKMDTEGYVLPILIGMKETIIKNNFPPLQIEMNSMIIEKENCINYLKRLGYREFSKTDVDYFFVKKD
jgi:FkbM family methyltransferase